MSEAVHLQAYKMYFYGKTKNMYSQFLRGFKKGVLRKRLAKIRLNLSIRRKKVLRNPTPVGFESGHSTVEIQWSYHKTTEQRYQID